MADDSGASSSLGFVVGILFVLVLVAAGLFVINRGGLMGGSTKTVDVNIKAPAISAPAKGG